MYSNLVYGTGGACSASISCNIPADSADCRLLPDYRLLLFISDIALALCAWPAYLIARQHFSKGLSRL